MRPTGRSQAAVDCDRLGRLFEKAYREARREDAYRNLELWVERAERSGDVVLIDRAHCIRWAQQVQDGDAEEAASHLGRLLLRSGDPENRRVAAYHLANAYDTRKDQKKALFYARLALEQAQTLQRPDWIASSENQMGCLFLSSSYFEKAADAFSGALRVIPASQEIDAAVIADNLGYCQVVLGRLEDGFRNLFQSLRTLRRTGAQRYEVEPRLSLSYAYLEVQRPAYSLKHGLRALALAEALEKQESIKMSLFLLGEAAKLVGNDMGAHRYFRRLQEAYYPEEVQLTDLLMVVDARSMVNLKA